MASREYYIDYLKKTDRFPRSVYHRAKHEKVREIFERLPRGSSVLDAGCGIGNVTDRYCSEYKVAGIDEQPSAIQYCRRFCGGDYKESSLYDIPFADNTFDVVFFLDAIEHLTQPERALGELARVLKVGGSILVCTINYANPLWFILENTWHRFFGGGCKTYS
ncbi:MAG: class I SAM-dependent methyltransferase, partial [Candidatus Omnitrophica bacterium]|nr:class I SAM-dependent methyltransferase [Candidatus Omnitrophota bacterium]